MSGKMGGNEQKNERKMRETNFPQNGGKIEIRKSSFQLSNSLGK